MKIDKKDHSLAVSEFQKEVSVVISKPVKFGLILLLVLVVGAGGWLVFAKLDKAAIAVGEIVPGGNNRVVQHLEGGVIEQILVKEGDVVKKGDILVKLSQKSAGANFEIYDSALNSSVAEYIRLSAEREGLDKIKFPEEWLKNPEKYSNYIQSQTQIFDERRISILGKTSILDERTNQLQSEIKGLNSQLSAARNQLQYTTSQVQVVEKLLAGGNTTMSRLLDLKTRRSEIEGRIGELTSSIAKSEQAISENKLNKINIQNENLNEVVEKMKEAQNRINELKERGGTASDTLSRTEIRAPADGIIKDLKFKTAGSAGVIPPNSEVLTIVPIADEMVAEVKINPTDIDVVRKPDLKTRVRLSAYSARHIPMLDGVLKNVSADIFKDQATQQNYYKGRVKIDISTLDRYLKDNKSVNHEQYLFPGMPVEVYIVTGERSPLSYMLDPLRSDMRKAFKEE
jgi:HlyD family secretion protein